MAINISDLPPQYQAQAMRKFIEQQASTPDVPTTLKSSKETKYHNTPTDRVTEIGTVLHFDSQKEARRYDALLLRLRAGHIRDLRLQVDFTLQEAYTDDRGRRIRAIRYRADFTYYQPPRNSIAQSADPKEIPWEYVVEDVKSSPTRTREYINKRKMMKDRFGIDISEV